MSHVDIISLLVKDLDAFRIACEKCGLQFMPNQSTYKWFGKWMQDYSGPQAAHQKIKLDGKCEHAARIPNDSQAYEIGLVKDPDGRDGLRPVVDWWGPGKRICDKVGGKDMHKLVQAYALEVGKKKMKAKGLNKFRQVETKDGELLAEFTA